MSPALCLLLDDPAGGIAGVTSDPVLAEAVLARVLDVGRAVSGVGRLLLVHPPEIESSLTAKALGWRLWPQAGDTPEHRFATAFQQAADLGHNGAVVVSVAALAAGSGALADAAATVASAETHGVLAADQHGAVAYLALHAPEPTLFRSGPMPDAAELRTRAQQLRINLAEAPTVQSLDPATLDAFLG